MDAMIEMQKLMRQALASRKAVTLDVISKKDVRGYNHSGCVMVRRIAWVQHGFIIAAIVTTQSGNLYQHPSGDFLDDYCVAVIGGEVESRAINALAKARGVAPTHEELGLWTPQQRHHADELQVGEAVITVFGPRLICKDNAPVEGNTPRWWAAGPDGVYSPIGIYRWSTTVKASPETRKQLIEARLEHLITHQAGGRNVYEWPTEAALSEAIAYWRHALG